MDTKDTPGQGVLSYLAATQLTPAGRSRVCRFDPLSYQETGYYNFGMEYLQCVTIA